MEVINLNLIPSGALPVVHASQYDEGRTFRANLMDGSTVYTLDGTEVLECDVKKPDGNIVTVAVTNTSDSYVEIDTTLQMCACAGESLAELHITKGAQEIGTLNFILAVERSPLEGGIESESDLHNLQEQIGEAVAEQYAAEDVVFDATPTAGHGTGFAVTSEGVKTALDEKASTDDLAPVATSGDYNDLDNLPTIPENLPDLGDVEITSPTAGQIIEYDDNDGKWKNVANPASTTNFGAPYDENTTYNVPSLVIENNLLYKLNDGEDGTTGPWDPTKWTQTSVAELAQLIGSLSSLTTTNKDSLVDAVNEVNGKVNAIGTIVQGSSTGGSAVFTRTWAAKASLTLTKGVWIINARVLLQQDNNGYRAMNITASSGDSTPQCTSPAINGNLTALSMAFMQNVTSSSATFYLNGIHNSTQNSELSMVSWFLNAVRIA